MNRQLWTRYLNGMASGAGSIVIKTGLSLLVIPIMLRTLGVDAFGLYILLIGILELSTLLDLGVTPALAKLLSGEGQTGGQERKRAYLGAGHGMLMAMCLLYALTGLALSPFFIGLFHIPEALHAVALPALMLVLLEGAMTLYSTYYRAVLLSLCVHQWTNAGDVLFYFVANLGTLAMLAAGYDLASVMAVRVVAAALRLALLMAQALRYEPGAWHSPARLDRTALKELLTLSGHGMLLNLSVIISHKIDVFIIAMFLPLSAVSVFEVVYRFLGITVQICVKLSEGVYPLFSRMAAEGRPYHKGARILFLRMSSFLNVTAALMLALILVFYAPLFNLFSAGRIPMADTLPLLWAAAPTLWSGVVQMPATAYLFTSGHQRYLTTSSMLTALANVVLSLILVQWLGVVGVALGTLIPQVLQHQASLIRTTCQALRITLGDYLGAVHGVLGLPLFLALAWALLWRPHIPESWAGLLPIAAVALTGMGMGLILWFQTTATPYEWALVRSKIWLPLQEKWRMRRLADRKVS